MIAEAAFLNAPCVVGVGRLGSSLARALHETGLAVAKVSARALVAGGAPPPDTATLVVLAVSDDAIEVVAERLRGRLPANAPVLHTSGARPSTILRTLAALGHPTGSCHPFQSFPETSGLAAFRGVTFDVEGAPLAVTAARALVDALSGKAVEIHTEAKALTHLAAALSANGLVGLLGAARDLLVASGFGEREALDALHPLVTTAVTWALDRTPEEALTGPVARGDEATLEVHRAALRQSFGDRLALYESLVLEQRRLVRRREEDAAAKRASSGTSGLLT